MKKGFYLQSLLFFCFILFSSIAKATVPTITANPANITICTGDTTFFAVTANDTPSTLPIKFSWQISTDGGTTWSPLKDTLEFTGSSTDTLRVIADVSINNTLYRSIATNTDGADTSTSGMLTVTFPYAGSIVGLSAVCKAGTITLSDAVTGGVWSSINNSLATVGSSSGIVTGVNIGYDTIKYTVTNSCGPATVWTLVRIDTVVTAAPITGPTVSCKSSYAINLMNANVWGSWIWSTSNGNAAVSSTGVLYGIAGGLDTITYAFTNACVSLTSTLVVTVDTILNAGSISGLSNICMGSGVHLSETVGGGIWISGSSAVAVVDAVGNVTGVSQGTAVISYLLSNACGASIATDTVHVYRNAAPITGIDSVGIGNTRLLMDSTAGGWWMSSDTSIAVIDTFTGLATGKDTGITVISYTVTNLCGTTIATLSLNVGPHPFVSGIYGSTGFDSAVCIGSTVTLLDSTQGGVGRWSSLRDTIATVDSITGIVTGVKTYFSTHFDTVHVGIDTIIYTFTNAFGTSKVQIPIIVNQPPFIHLTGPSVISSGGNYMFRATPYYDWIHTPSTVFLPNGSTTTHAGVWSDSNNVLGVFVSHIDSSGLHETSFGSYVVTGLGRDKITYTISNGCGPSHSDFVISLVLGVNSVNDINATMKVFPNPTDGAVTINISSQVNEDAKLVITNVLGEKVKELNVTTNKPYSIQLDQPAGMYFLTATGATGKCDAKIVIGK